MVSPVSGAAPKAGHRLAASRVGEHGGRRRGGRRSRLQGRGLDLPAAAHILPENVERELPRAVEIAKQNGLTTPMMITSINDAATPNAEAVLDTMRKLGITRYRAPNYRYDHSKDMQSQWDALKPRSRHWPS